MSKFLDFFKTGNLRNWPPYLFDLFSKLKEFAVFVLISLGSVVFTQALAADAMTGMDSASVIQIMTNGINDLQGVSSVIFYFAFFTGFVMVIWGVIKATSGRTNNHSNEVKSGVVMMIIGSVLLSLAVFINSMTESLLGVGNGSYTINSSADSLVLNSASTSTSMYSAMQLFALAASQVVGLVAIVKGLIGLNSSVDDKNKFWPSIVFLIGGFMSMNLPAIIYAYGDLFKAVGISVGAMSIPGVN